MKINWFNTLTFAIIFLLILFLFQQCNQNKNLESIIQSQYDTLVVKRNAEGKEVASRQVFVATIEQMKMLSGSKDSLISELQKTITKQTVSLTILKTKTHERNTSPTVIINGTDTGQIDTTRISRFYGTYTSKGFSKWSEYTIVAGPDTTILDYISFNQFSIKQEWQKQKGLKGFFQPKVLQVSITNDNPHTETIGVQSWHIPLQKKYTGLKIFGTGVVIGVGMGYLLFH
jgi:hypothetical protein